MSVSKMQKLTVLTTAKEASGVLDRLTALKLFMPIAAPSEEPTPLTEVLTARYAEADALATAAEHAVRVLRRHRKGYHNPYAPRPLVSAEDYEADGRGDLARKVVDEVGRIEKQQEACRARLQELKDQIALCRPFAAWPYPSDVKGTDKTLLLPGRFPAGVGSTQWEGALGHIPAAVLPQGREQNGTAVMLSVYKGEEEAALQALKTVGFVPLTLPEASCTLKTLCDRFAAEQSRIREELEHTEARLAALSEKVDEVEILADLTDTARRKAACLKDARHTQRTVTLTGYCPVGAEERVEGALAPFCAAHAFEEAGEEAPLPPEKQGFFAKLRRLCRPYRTPRLLGRDISLLPQVILWLLFGLLLADGGHGLITALICFGLVRFAYPAPKLSRFLLLLGGGALFAALLGGLQTAFFGNFHVAAEAPLQQWLQFFHPRYQPWRLFCLLMAMGGVLVLIDRTAKAARLIKAQKGRMALLDVLCHYPLYAGAVVAFFHPVAGGIAAGVGLLLLLLTQGRRGKGFAARLRFALWGLVRLADDALTLLGLTPALWLIPVGWLAGQLMPEAVPLWTLPFLAQLLLFGMFALLHFCRLGTGLLGRWVHKRLLTHPVIGILYDGEKTAFTPLVPTARYRKYKE